MSGLLSNERYEELNMDSAKAVNGTIRETILDDAKHAVCGDRDHQYGSPEDNFDQIARFWSVYLHSDLTSCDVTNMMILFKLARNMTGNPKLDNWVDIAGYAACGADCQCYLKNKKGATK